MNSVFETPPRLITWGFPFLGGGLVWSALALRNVHSILGTTLRREINPLAKVSGKQGRHSCRPSDFQTPDNLT